MELHAHIPRMVFEFQDLHPNTLVILAYKLKSTLRKTVNVVGVDFISMAMSLVNLLHLPIQLSETGPLASRLKERGADTETHCSSKSGFIDLGHEDHNRVGTVVIEFDGFGARDTADVSRKLDDGDLHTEADTKERDFVLASPFCCLDHTLCTSMAETAWNENSVRGADFVPCFVEGGWVVDLGLVFEIGSIDPDEVEFLAAAHGAVLEGFDDREVAVVEGGVFSYQDYGDGIEEAFLLGCESVPFCPSTLAAVDERLRLGDVVELEDIPDCGYEALLFEEKRDMVS